MRNLLHLGVPLQHVEDFVPVAARAGADFAHDLTGLPSPRDLSGWNAWSEAIGVNGNDATTAHLVAPVVDVSGAIKILRALNRHYGTDTPLVPVGASWPKLRAILETPPIAAVTNAKDYEVDVYELALVEDNIQAYLLPWTTRVEHRRADRMARAGMRDALAEADRLAKPELFQEPEPELCAACGRDVMDEMRSPDLKDTCVDCAEAGLEQAEPSTEQTTSASLAVVDAGQVN
jgi:hypothetical protein